MIFLASSILALAVALPLSLLVVRSLVLGYEDRRATAAKERWDERVDRAVAAAEAEAARLDAVEKEVVGLEKRVQAVQTAAGFRPPRLRGG